MARAGGTGWLARAGGHGGHRPCKLMPHRDFLEAARTEKSDITLQALCDRLLSERGVKADTSMMSRFFRRIGVTLKKRPSSRASKIVGHKPPPQTMASLSGPHRSQAIGVHRRDLDENQHDPSARLGAKGRAARRQGSSRPLEDRDFPRRSAQRPYRSACLFDGPINGERFHAYVEQFLAPTLKSGKVISKPRIAQGRGGVASDRAFGARRVLTKKSPDANDERLRAGLKRTWHGAREATKRQSRPQNWLNTRCRMAAYFRAR